MNQSSGTVVTTTPLPHSTSRRTAVFRGATAALAALVAVVPHREAQAALTPTFRCSKGVSAGPFSSSQARFAQTFTGTRAGELREVRVVINKPSGTAGNYVVQLDPTFGGIPAHEALWVFAAGMVPDADVPFGNSTLVVKFGGTRISKGGKYAVVVMRLGTATLTVPTSTNATCPNGMMYVAESDQEFVELAASRDFEGDMIVSVLVV